MSIPCQRHLFEIPDDTAYFNCAYTSPLMTAAAKAGAQAIAEKQAAWTLAPTRFFSSVEAVRGLFAQLVDATADGVAIIPAVSYGISLAARNLPVQQGQNIVVLAEQFPSNIYVWMKKAEACGADIRTVPRPENGDWTPGVMSAIDANTAIAALPNCHWTDGTMVDLAAVGEKCRANGAALVVDAIQSLGAMPFSVREVQPDFLVAGAHKWLLGPYGFGFCYVDEKWRGGEPLEENWMNREGSEDFSRLVDYREGYQPGARRFDMGGASSFILSPIAEAALTRILEWGVPNIADTLRARTNELAERAKPLGTTVYDVRAPHLLGLCREIGWPSDLPARLTANRVFVSVRGKAIRISTHLWNTDQDVDRLFNALESAVK